MRRIHPFVAGHVVAGLIVGAGVGVTLDAEAAVLGGALLAAGAAVSSLVCWWKPGLEAPAWQLLPVALLANPLMLVALGYMASEFDCVVGARRGWGCLGTAIAIVVAGACVPPPLLAGAWRWWRRRRASPG
ncbi:hypothetical protein [Reyranella sp.]|uniref:hypothetical protein n=1 Tax=Reyranella sp. TaxID=1929291 RepID=UPI003BAD4561